MGGEYSLCSRLDDLTYDPVQYQPSAYVRVIRQQHMQALMAQQKDLPKVQNTDDMTIEELRAYYDKGGANRVAAMDASAQENLFKKFIEDQNKQRQKQVRKNTALVRPRVNSNQLRNRSIKQRDFKSRMGLNASKHYKTPSSDAGSNDNSVIIRRVETEEDDNDVSIVQLNQSNLDESMASLGNTSMASFADESVEMVKKVNDSRVSDGGSMYSQGDVQVIKANTGGGNTTMDMDMSMAGLSDMSMGDIDVVQKVGGGAAGGLGNDSMADLSMASLGAGEDSMASMGDSGYKPMEMNRDKSVTTQGDSDTGELLADLKREFEVQENKYRASVVFDEDEEYSDSDEEGKEDGRPRRRSIKKATRPGQQSTQAQRPEVSPSNKQKMNKLMSLVGGGKKAFKADDVIEERTLTQENESPSRDSISEGQQDISASSLRQDTNNSNASGHQKFGLRLKQSLRDCKNSDIDNSDSDDDDDDSSSEEDTPTDVKPKAGALAAAENSDDDE